MKQTAVEYLFEKLWQTSKDKLNWHSYLQKAKEIEQQQMQDFYLKGNYMGCGCHDWATKKDFEEEYKKEYGK